MKYKNKDLLDLYKLKVEEHWYTMFNPILEYLGDIRGKKILDIGCGSGELTNELSKKAKLVVGVDFSQEWIDYCRGKYTNKNLNFIKAKASNLRSFKNDYFDIVVMNMVLPNIETAGDVKKTFEEIGRVIKKSGVFIFSDLHPLCIMAAEEGNRKQKYSKNFSYFKNGAEFSALVKIAGKEIEFKNNHWTFDFCTDILNKEGIYINKIIESSYPKNAPKKFYQYSYPEYIIFCCKKRP